MKSSWIPLKKFTKSYIHPDWMFGCTSFQGYKDKLNPNIIIRKYDPVFWNRSLNNATITLQSYNEAIKSGNNETLEKLKVLGLSTDIKIN